MIDYVVNYEYEGHTYDFMISADSKEEAEARLEAAMNSAYLTEIFLNYEDEEG